MFIDAVNECLSHVGRSLGYRVWQSIEHYMANYPTVLAAQEALKVAEGQNNEDAKQKETAKRDRALETAFEDQLVQKVMPKLRGIETSGDQRKKCLDPIKEALKVRDFTILGDFEKACRFGDGQFIWNSSDYLQDETHA
ncbi:hypothetical protein FACS189442_5590 [Spirochaetia bacterium]|nr:hypothetical protein FACS189442_5590 [Spirochaetia bacterium]